jgi:hypothetical protein
MRTYPAVGLLVLGLAQMAGDVLHLPALKGIAAATAASPAPKVFSAVRGLETYSTRFYLEGDDRAHVHHVFPLTPEVYARLRGPYNRRNVFGAVLAYGPVLVSDPRTRAMFDSVARYALCGEAPILRELGVDPGAVSEHLRVRLDPRPGSELGDLPLTIEPVCP